MAKLMMKWFQVLALSAGLVVASGTWSEELYGDAVLETEHPSYGAVMLDTFIARPIGVVATVLGAAIWVVTSPLTAVTGTIGEAGKTLVLEPFATTFVRCLGCSEIGWRKMPPAEDAE
jgi:hypothetical protein